MDLCWCRLCVNVVDARAENIFYNSILLKQVEEIIGSKLKNDVDLPQYICQDCELTLETTHKFRVRCLRAQNYFCSEKFKERLTTQLKNEDDENIHFDNNLIQIEEDINEYYVSIEDEDCTYEEVYLDSDSLDLEDMLFNEESHSEQISVEEDEAGSMPFLIYDKEPTIHKKKPTQKSNNKRTYVCEICGHLFTAQNHYHYHMRRHLGDKRYHCKFCPSKFVGSTELKVHMRKHTGERPYPCRYCERKFTCESHRKRHEGAVHTNERPHICLFCKKSFATISTLKKHLMIHSDDRPFTCKLCDRSFVQRNNFLTHCKSNSHKQKEIEQKGSD